MPFNQAIPIFDFKGLRNDLDPALLNNNALQECINFDIDNEGWLHTRGTLTQLAEDDLTTVSAIFVTDDKQAAFVIADEALFKINPADDTLIPYLDNIGEGPYVFTNAGSAVFLLTKEFSFAIYETLITNWGIPNPPMPVANVLKGSGSLCKGRYSIAYAYQSITTGVVSGSHAINIIEVEEGDAIALEDIPQQAGFNTIVLASLVEGTELFELVVLKSETGYVINELLNLTMPFHYVNCFPPPIGNQSAFWQASLWVSIYNKDTEHSEVFSSKPNSFHHFDLGSSHGITEQGEIRMLVGTDAGLLIGTDRQVILYSSIDRRTELMQYGVPKGHQWDFDIDRNVWFTTERGIRVLRTNGNLEAPNEEAYLTEWGSKVGTGFVQKDGMQQFISCTLETDQGFNSYLEPVAITLFDHGNRSY